jgi:hypothetical protein
LNKKNLSRGFSLSTGGTRTTVLTTTTTDISLSSNGVSNLNTGEVFKVNSLEEFLGLGVNLDERGIQSREFGNKVITTFTFFFLKLEGDTTDGTARNTLHQVSGETSNLVTETLGVNDGDFIKNSLVDLEIESKTRVVLLNDNTGCLLDSLSSNATLNNLYMVNIYLSVYPSIHPSIYIYHLKMQLDMLCLDGWMGISYLTILVIYNLKRKI